MPKITTKASAKSPKPPTPKYKGKAAIAAPLPPLSRPMSLPAFPPSSAHGALVAPESQTPVRITLKLNMRKAAEGRKALVEVTNIASPVAERKTKVRKARLGEEPYPISQLRRTANIIPLIDLDVDPSEERPVAAERFTFETELQDLSNIEALWAYTPSDDTILDSSIEMDDVPATNTAAVPSVASMTVLPVAKPRHRISAATKAARRSMFNVTLAKRGRTAAKAFTMADKIALAKSFETVFETPRLELPAMEDFPPECLTGVMFFAIQQYFIRANISHFDIRCLKPALGKSSIHIITPKSSLGKFEKGVKEIVRGYLGLITTYPVPFKSTPIVPCWME